MTTKNYGIYCFKGFLEWREVEKNLDAKIALEDVLDEMILLED